MCGEVRRAEPRDARGIARVHAAAWQSAYADLLPASYLGSLSTETVAPIWRRRLDHAPPGLDAWVATIEGEVAGFCIAHAHRERDGFQGWAGEVSYLYVHPALERRGLGGALLERALGRLERRGHRWAVVCVLEGNGPARAFYERHGLRPDGARWIDHRFGVPVVRHARALNPVVDFARLRPLTAREGGRRKGDLA